MGRFQNLYVAKPYSLEVSLSLGKRYGFSASLLWERLRTAWPQWENEPFDAHFQSNEMILLKKSSRSGRYEVVERHPFPGISGNEFASGLWFY